MNPPGSPASRVDRLLTLIENASTGVAVRMMAAKQVASHVELLVSRDEQRAAHPVIAKIIRILLVSKSWDVRVAAELALSLGLSCFLNADQYIDTGTTDSCNDEQRALKIIMALPASRLSELFDPLVASSGAEFDVDLSAMNAADRISQQKKNLKKTLELIEGLGDLAGEIIDDRDLMTFESTANPKVEPSRTRSEAPPEPARKMSVREEAIRRRKSRAFSKTTDMANMLRRPVKLELVPELEDKLMSTGDHDICLKTILTLRSNVLNSNWTVRHGALLGLVSILKHCSELSLLLLAVLARDTLAVLALDRFADFVGDQTVAPIRETAAQCLVLISRLLRNNPSIQGALWEVILGMAQTADDWQERHSAFLCIKYRSAMDGQSFSPQDHLEKDRLLELLLGGCDDFDEDIKSMSTELLGRLLAKGRDLIGEDQFQLISQRILDILAEDSEDSAIATSTLVNALELLKYLISTPPERERVLWILAFRMRHPMVAVRQAVLNVFNDNSLFDAKALDATNSLLIFRLLVQNIILDDQSDIRRMSATLAEKIDVKADCPQLLATFVSLCSIILLPHDRPLDPKQFIFVSSLDDDGRPMFHPVPAAHEIGFKSADAMVLTASGRLEARRKAASCVATNVSHLYPQAFHMKICATLVREEDPLSSMCGLWLFGRSVRPADLPPPDEDDIWMLRKWCAWQLSADAKVPLEILVKYMRVETEACLQDDAASLLQRSSYAQESTILFQALYDAQGRRNALPVMIRAFEDRPGKLMELADDTTDATSNHQLAVQLVYISVAEAKALTRIPPVLSKSISEPDANIDLVVEAFTVLSYKCPVALVEFLVKHVNPLLESSPGVTSTRLRCLQIYERLFSLDTSPELSSLASLFLIPILRRIADAEPEVRAIASPLFALLMRLLPLKTSKPAGLALQSLSAQQREADEFLSHFIGDSMEDLKRGGNQRAMAIPNYDLPVEIKADLRPYQKAGINWMLYLAKYGLHGALCDDMGLGKTLQTIAVLASDHYDRFALHGDDEAISLIVCPASLVGHWQHEIQHYAPSLGRPTIYSGAASERRKSWAALMTARESKSPQCPRTIVTSYETVRSDIATLSGIRWNYVVLDEGHMIKNPKTKLTLAVKLLKAEHRLILSGTPIQNNVVELWSLFDFLMPGMLGTEAHFMDRYGRAIMAVQPVVTNSADNSKGVNGASSSSTASCKAGMREFEDAEKKIAALHKQVLPFLLRRMKEDVLKELPPKIIQDYECDPSPIQRLLYEDLFSDPSLRKDVAQSLSEGEVRKERMHVFQTLQYLRKLFVHPNLVLTDDHPLMPAVREMSRVGIEQEGQHHREALDDLAIAPKFQLLKELLEECGLGSPDEKESILVGSETPHRVLIFAQQKSTLDLIESLVFKRHLPHISYLRLDGSVEQGERFGIAQRFNSDSTIDVLLLTTPVGGLGLNLTGADTVIFVEHDWNPMKDLQAMDRAHRLGQKRVVSVYRLIMRGTLEEQILGLQRWKSKVAATIVQQQATLQGDFKMQSDNLLDLLVCEEDANEERSEGDGKRRKTANRPGPHAMDQWLAKHGAMLDVDPDVATGGEDSMSKIQQEYALALDADAFAKSVTNTRTEGGLPRDDSNA